MKPPQFNWHFWIKGHKLQVVITTSNWSSAVCRLKKFIGPKTKYTFQFGERE
jgi:hypothetical protein